MKRLRALKLSRVRDYFTFCRDIPAADLRGIITRTYTAEAFQSAGDHAPCDAGTRAEHPAIVEGPTLAFKDIALQLLGNLCAYVLAKTEERLNILGATSGDTGPSAEYAMRGKRSVRVFMLSPRGR